MKSRDLIANVTGVILVGGRSTRLGQDKAHLQLRDRPLLEDTVRLLHDLFAEVLLVAAPRQKLPRLPKTRIVHDEVPDLGPIGGLSTALGAVRTDYAFVIACDMPFLDADLIRKQCEVLDRSHPAAVVPRGGGRVQPLHALYRRSCRATIEALISEGTRRIADLFARIETQFIDEPDDPRAFFNINTPSDLSRARRSVPSKGRPNPRPAD